MLTKKLLTLSRLLLIFTCSSCSSQAGITTKQLHCEYTANPIGIDTTEPRFTWILKSTRRAQMQSAYHILVASTEEKLKANIGDKWDSGKVVSDKSVNILYQGKSLSSSEKCYWKVRIWDKNGKPSSPSKPATEYF